MVEHLGLCGLVPVSTTSGRLPRVRKRPATCIVFSAPIASRINGASDVPTYAVEIAVDPNVGPGGFNGRNRAILSRQPPERLQHEQGLRAANVRPEAPCASIDLIGMRGVDEY